MISFAQALNIVQEKLAAWRLRPVPDGTGLGLGTEVVSLAEARGRILAEEIAADRDYPPFHRALRDGFAVRAAEVCAGPVVLRRCGEARAGEHFVGAVGAGECVSIMTGAPLPAGADAVVMVEHTEPLGEEIRIHKAVFPGENVVQQGSEARAGTRVLQPGRRLGAAELGLLAALGKWRIKVYVRPCVAILPTGDEVVPIEQQPAWFQIRNSNAWLLSAQVAAAGGIARRMEIAPDRLETLRALIQEGLTADLLLLTGGVSVGKYDFVPQALAGLGAEFYFQGVALRPGKPLVFGRAREKFFFGLPGNPVSTLVTFELFARPAIVALGGGDFEPPIFVRARLSQPFQQRTGLTVFLPARVARVAGEPVVEPVSWQGSGDLVGVAAANSFMVVHPDQTDLVAGDWVDVMLREQ
jgi:molybdopterin molybdotransferase